MGAFNCARTLRVCVSSIQAQTFSDWEFIICNDCSSDDTKDVIKSIANEDKRIKLIENSRNCGLANCLNRCLEYAQGEYIARMDADDISLPDRFAIQVDYLDSNPDIDVVAGGVILYDDLGDKKRIFNPENPTARLMTMRVPFFHPTIMMRKTAYDRLLGYTDLPRTRRGQDMDLWYRFFAAGMKGYNLQIAVLKYHDGVSDVKKKKSLKLAWHHTLTKLIGFKMNNFPVYLYPYAFIPLVSCILPNRLVYFIHNHIN